VELPTPLEAAPEPLRGGRELYFKREDVHELGAFKWRGALPTVRAYKENGASAVVTASTGNHGAATAWRRPASAPAPSSSCRMAQRGRRPT